MSPQKGNLKKKSANISLVYNHVLWTPAELRLMFVFTGSSMHVPKSNIIIKHFSLGHFSDQRRNESIRKTKECLLGSNLIPQCSHSQPGWWYWSFLPQQNLTVARKVGKNGDKNRSQLFTNLGTPLHRRLNPSCYWLLIKAGTIKGCGLWNLSFLALFSNLHSRH